MEKDGRDIVNEWENINQEWGLKGGDGDLVKSGVNEIENKEWGRSLGGISKRIATLLMIMMVTFWINEKTLANNGSEENQKAYNEYKKRLQNEFTYISGDFWRKEIREHEKKLEEMIEEYGKDVNFHSALLDVLENDPKVKEVLWFMDQIIEEGDRKGHSQEEVSKQIIRWIKESFEQEGAYFSMEKNKQEKEKLLKKIGLYMETLKVGGKEKEEGIKKRKKGEIIREVWI